MSIRNIVGAATIVASILGFITPGWSQEFYKDKDVEFVVPFSAGGGNDTFSRFLQGYFQTCIPGVSSVQTINVPGGGTVIGANEFELVRDHDGTSLLVTSGTTLYAWLLGQQGVRFSPRNWRAILGMPGGGVVYVNPQTGVETPQDLVETDAEIVFGGISPVALDLLPLLTFEILGAKPKVVMGYEGKGPVRIAFQQGEVNLDYSSTDSYLAQVQPLVDDGKARPLYSLGHVRNGDLIRDPAFPDIPSFKEAYEQVHGAPPSGFAWEAYLALVSSGVSAQRQVWVHNDAPQQAVEALRTAAQCVVKQEDFYEKGEKLLAGYDPIVGDELDSEISSMLGVSDDVIAWLQNFVSEEYDVQIK